MLSVFSHAARSTASVLPLRCSVLVASTVVALVCPSSTADAEYFGRSRVQYDDLSFQVPPAAHFRLHFHPTVDGAISQGTGGVTERLRERVIMPFTGVHAESEHVQPLFGREEFALLPLSFLPVEVAPFPDARIAGSTGDEVDLRLSSTASTRVPVFSSGIAVRTNRGGFAVAERFRATAFQRATGPGRFGFQLQPGW